MLKCRSTSQLFYFYFLIPCAKQLCFRSAKVEVEPFEVIYHYSFYIGSGSGNISTDGIREEWDTIL